MAKVRQILKHVTIDIAKRIRHCRQNREHRIKSGQSCLVIRDDCSPYSRQYCTQCAEEIFETMRR